MKNIKPTVLDLFLKQVEQTPDQIAISDKGEEMTFSVLNEKANQLANYLIKQGVKSESPVGICMERSTQMIVGILGILKAGGAFVPIDPQYPEDRISYILDNTAARFVLSSDIASEKVANADHSEHLAIIRLDSNAHGIGDYDTTPPAAVISPSQLAYVIYTSGSTGRPKGVMIEHQSLANYITWSAAYYLRNQPSVFPLYTSIAFDLTITSIFTPLTTGNRLVIYGDDGSNLVVEQVFTEGIANVIKLTPSHLKLVGRSQSVKANIPQQPLKLIVGGEELETALAREIHDLFTNGVEIFNEYGPTEATVGCMIYKFDPNEQDLPAVPIGVAIDNCEIHLLDQHLRPVEQGSIGEIYISGECLARGYYANEPLTGERFLDHPSIAGKKMYKTGDNAIMLPQQGLLYKGRSDDQVKLRGYRIELGEIDHQVSSLDGVKDAITVVREDHPGLQRLIAYVVLENKAAEEWPLAKNWRTALKQQLPDYMIPDALAFLPKLPLTVNGKIDKKALPKPAMSRDIQGSGTPYRKPTSIVEEQIVSLWEALLAIDKVGVDDNFFEWGGNSLLAVQFVSAMKETYGHDLPVIALYQHPTPAKLGASLMPAAVKGSVRPKKNKRNKAAKDIAIIGLNGRFPGAETIEELWNVLVSGKETTTFFTAEELDAQIPDHIKHNPAYVSARGILEHAELFDADFFGMTPVMAKLMDPQQRVFLEICYELLESTGHLPARYPGAIGVYAGCGNNSYYVKNLISNPQEIDKIGEFQVLIANDKDYIASRTAYQLDLKGPAVSVYSACSTSLLAVAQAVDAIRAGQCDVAIAGGIAITVPIKSGHLYEEGAILSKDGHCRPFDAHAQGTVFSDGAAVVLLKDLEQAKQDNDTIYAVIKGVGINNDGGGKGSFTAPSAEGQAGAIAAAIADAGVDPAAIGYVEAHGTATPLGDPIEIEGLKLAFGKQESTQFCRIGSIKGNIGHLTHAAGAAGLIKTALAMHRGVLPPSINYDAPNPNIDFVHSPFIVADKLTPWSELGTRYAGVSSFGVGGTNVHVILEAYEGASPKRTQESQDTPALIHWSAKSAPALAQYADRLAAYLERNPDTPILDIASTLQRTRPDYHHRGYIAAVGTQDLIAQLRAKAWQNALLAESGASVAFMFPGQGAQYVNMGKSLYEREPVYRKAIDECADLLQPIMGEDIRQVIFADPNTEATAQHLKNTYYTQPALFITEYALASLWMSWGIQPAAFIGHSVGEFVAAHLAGVFSLADALKLIYTRGKLISGLPGGGMLSIRKSVQEITPSLPQGLSVAAVNAPNLCVVAGDHTLIKQYAEQLEAQQVKVGLLHTSHAFHSEMMSPILDDFEQVVTSISLNVPQKPIASTVTGTWMKDSEATSPSYWVNHVRATVRFSDAFLFIHEALDAVFLEVGPGNVTATLAKQHGGVRTAKIIGGLDATNESKEYQSVLHALGKLWLNGISPDWKAVHGTDRPAVIADLPTYAFHKQPHWIAPKLQVGLPEERMANPIADTPSISQPEATDSREDTLTDRITDVLEDCTGFTLDRTNVHSSFIELGFDSLLLTQVAFNLKKAFGLPITFRMLNETCNSIALLAAYIRDQGYTAPVAATVKDPMPPAKREDSPHTFEERISEQLQLLFQQVSVLQQAISGLPTGTVQPAVASTAVNRREAERRPFRTPPMPGARLGKNRDGKPAWFVESQQYPGKYEEIVTQ